MAIWHETILPSTTVTTAKTVVGPWIDVDQYQELYGWLNVTAFASRANETLTVTIERWADNDVGYTNVLAFTAISGTGAASEEKTAVSLLGGRVRYRYVTGGTWSSKSITFNIGLMAKALLG
jgi:hypothetical protein